MSLQNQSLKAGLQTLHETDVSQECGRRSSLDGRSARFQRKLSSICFCNLLYEYVGNGQESSKELHSCGLNIGAMSMSKGKDSHYWYREPVLDSVWIQKHPVKGSPPQAQGLQPFLSDPQPQGKQSVRTPSTNLHEVTSIQVSMGSMSSSPFKSFSSSCDGSARCEAAFTLGFWTR